MTAVPNLETIRTTALLELQADILAELRARQVVRSSNNPTGDYAEILFARAFGWTLTSKSSTDVDAEDRDGSRYQIKSRRITTHNRSRQLGFMRRLPDRPFDYLAAVLFDERFCVLKAAIVPFDLMVEKCAFVASVNAWRFIMRDEVWAWDSVVDVTQMLLKTQQEL